MSIVLKDQTKEKETGKEAVLEAWPVVHNHVVAVLIRIRLAVCLDSFLELIHGNDFSDIFDDEVAFHQILFRE